jgi:hypothetical protein
MNDPTQSPTTSPATWTPDDEGGCRSGDHRLTLAPDDPTRWLLTDPDGIVTGGQVPHPGYTDLGLLAVLDYHLSEFGLGVVGLDPWCEEAEGRAALAYAEREDAERERAQRPALPGRLAADLLREEPEEIDWLVPGFVAPGWTVKVAAREKVGKGTLGLYVIGKLERGEETVFGPTPHPATAVILTEEPVESMAEKVRLFGVRRARIIYGFEFAALTWEEKVAALVEVAVTEGHALIFVDNVSRAAGIEDEAGTELARAIEHLQDRCRANRIAAWIDHHHKKGSGAARDKSRGSTSIAGAADLNVDMFPEGGGRVRKLTSLGRVRAATWTRNVELSEDGTDYRLVAEAEDATDDARAEAEATADLMILKQQGEVTVSQFMQIRGLPKTSARRRLDEMVERGQAVLEKQGAGKPNVYRPTPSQG